MNKSIIKANGFECTQCKKIVLDGHKHDNEEDICDQCKIANLEKQLTITEKALELACEEIIGSCEYCSYNTMPECPIEADCLDEKINYFKAKAKEMLENEKRI